MPNFLPFRGFRHDQELTGPLDRIVTQPYDKIPDELLADYQERSPLNVVHVIRNTNYLQAAELFHGWIETGLLKQDSTAFYPYEQEFTIAGEVVARLGVIGLVPLGTTASVKGHERTHEGPLVDRLELMRAGESNDGLLFSLFSDPDRQADKVLESFTESTAPAIDVRDDFGFRHRVWVLEDKLLQSQITQSIDGRPIYIADGHHRYETARRYQSECLDKGWKPAGVESFDHRMMALFNMANPGLRILPTHRGLKNFSNWDADSVEERLGRFFEIHEISGWESLKQQLASEGRCVGMAFGRSPRFLLLKLIPSQLDAALAHLEPVEQALDVNLLHEGVLAGCLGVDRTAVGGGEHIDYFRSPEKLLARLEDGIYQSAFFLNATSLKQVREISEAGLSMPQKSTDFFPKLLTGLVFMKMEIEKAGVEVRQAGVEQ